MNKIFKNIARLFVCTSACLLTSSCSDWLELYPQDEIIEDEYWTSSEDVEMMVAGAYRYMLETDVLRRFVYLGEMRSDNLGAGSTTSEESAVLNDGNLLSSNSLCKWNAFYKVINICNYIIDKAPGVRDVDSNYLLTDLQHHLAEAYFIRSLCYFYLTRGWGDVVPYVDTPSNSDATDYNVAATPEDELLAHLIEDLKLAKEYATPSWGTQKNNCGRVTQNAVRALLADVYLWAEQYQNAINECDEVLDNYVILAGSENTAWTLLPRSTFFNKVFYSGNSIESIFELNLNSDNSSNRSAFVALYGNASTTPRLKPTNNLLNQYDDADARGFQFIDISQTRVFKYVGQTAPGSDSKTDAANESYTYRATSGVNNWIVYRLADIYLMKAEALAQVATTTEEFETVVDLCNMTYERAQPEGGASLSYSDATDRSSAADMVMQERRREFAFEGKRWFDLLRQVRRDGGPTDAVITSLVENKYSGTSPAGISAKLSNIGYWYWPIHEDQIEVNDQLQQNEYYQKQESN